MSAGDAAFLGQVWCLNMALSTALYQHWVVHFCPSLLSMSCLDRVGKKIVSSKHKRMKKKIFGNHCYSVSMVKFSWLYLVFLSWCFRCIGIIWMNTSCKRRLKNGNVKPAEDKCCAVLHSTAYGAEIRRHGVTFSLMSLVTVLEPLFLCFSRNSVRAWLYVWIWFHLGSNLRSEHSKKFVVGAIVSVANRPGAGTFFAFLQQDPPVLVFGTTDIVLEKNYGMSKKHVIHMNWFLFCFRAVTQGWQSF